MTRRGSLLVVEIRRQTLTRIWLDGRKSIVANLGGGPNGAAIGPDGYCYLVNNGGFYFTDPGKTRHRDWDRGSVCYAKADGSMIREIIFPIHKPNGIGLSPDGKTLYVAETESARLWAWDLKGPGELARPAVASAQSPHGSRLVYGWPTYARFDSLAVEANGNICVGTLDKGGITVCAPSARLSCFAARRLRQLPKLIPSRIMKPYPWSHRFPESSCRTRPCRSAPCAN